jgi:hypothetical protein
MRQSRNEKQFADIAGGDADNFGIFLVGDAVNKRDARKRVG